MAHEHGEEFPREATRDLVGEALRAQERRAWLQDLAVALGLALLALGLPTERLLPAESLFASERAGFLASAVSFALGWLVLVRTARRNGWEPGSALRASCAAAALPPVLLAATTPGPAALAWLGGALGLAALTLELRPAQRVAGCTLAGLLILAPAFGRTGPASPWGGLLAPPALTGFAPLASLALLELEKCHRKTGWIVLLALASGAGALAWARLADPERRWRTLAEEQLEPADLVLTASGVHARLLAQRYGLEARMPEAATAAAVEAARAARRRVVLDESALEELDAPTRAWAERAATVHLRAR